jgi:hypothetical protein
VPYDRRYENLYLAFIAGVSGFGLTPRATVEIPGSRRRLDRIVGLLRRCRYSFHDLSHVGLDRRPPPTPRFNMPFELGLAVGLSSSRLQNHEWFVFEEKRHRLSKSLSDLGGTDPYIHGRSPDGVLSALTNALVRSRQRPTVTQLTAIYRDLKRGAVVIKKNIGTASLFEARPFRELAITARLSAEARMAPVRRHTPRRDDILRAHPTVRGGDPHEHERYPRHRR